MYTYIYNLRWDEDGPYLDTFYEIENTYSSEEEFLLAHALDDTVIPSAHAEYRRLEAIDIRARLNLMTNKIVKSEIPMTREHWEHFLKWEWEHDPKSRWLES